MSEIKAIIFDMDGVILDSESICDDVWELAAKQWNLPYTNEIINACRGTNKTDTIAILKQYYGKDFDSEKFIERTSELFHEVEFSKGIPLMKYASQALEQLKQKYRIALASSTKGSTVRRQLTATNVLQFFETLTTGDQVVHSKPDPEIYLMACNSLGLKPEECMAVEDSPNGIKSAFAAGLITVMIPDKIEPDEQLKTKCNFIYKNLEDFTNSLIRK